MNNGILAPQPFSSAVSMMDSTMEPLLGNAQPIPTPYHYPQSYNFRIGNSDGVSGKDFVFVVDTTILGSTTISIPLNGLGGDRVSVDWGDGTLGAIATGNTQRAGSYETLFIFTTTNISNISHTYAKHGVYTIILRGVFRLGYGNNLLSSTAILSYGDTNYTSIFLAHSVSTNLVYVPPQIPFSITNLQACFQNNPRFNHPNVKFWDVSRVGNMQQTFAGATAFNQDLDLWANKVSGVSNFGSTFSVARAFDGSVSGWVLGGANCGGMFFQALNFTGKGIQSWSVGNVTNMSNMFFDCPRLGVGISGNWNWDTKNVTSTVTMFYGVPLNNVTFSGWDLSKSNCSEMFRAGSINNCSFPNWIVNNATSMFTFGTVNNCTLSGWRITSTAASMFSSATANNLYMPSWSLSGSAASMFFGSNGTKSGLNDWNVSGVTNMSSMFQFGSDFMVADLSNWDIRNVTTFQNFMLRGISTNPSGSITINNWDIPNGCNCNGMFGDLGSNKYASLSGWNFQGNNSCDRMFGGFNYSFPSFDNIPGLASWQTSGIVNTNRMFYGSYLQPDVENWDVSNVTDMTEMFLSNRAFNKNLGSWNTSKVTGMVGIFDSTNAFNSTQGFFGSGIENWDVSSVTSMARMFNENYVMNRNLSGWNTGKVTSMANMFSAAGAGANSSFTGGGLNNWNVTGVTTIASMFQAASNKTNLNVNLSGWNLCNCTNMTNFMLNCNIGSGNYDILLNSWEASSTGNPIKPWATGINVHFGSAKYTAASSGARQRLINYGWTITDGGFQS